MHEVAARWAAGSGVWLLVAVASLSMFLFLLSYLYILYPAEAFKAKDGQNHFSLIQAKIVSADGNVSHQESPLYHDLSRFFRRVIGHGSGSEYADVKMRPFRSMSFLFVTLPSSYFMWRSATQEGGEAR